MLPRMLAVGVDLSAEDLKTSVASVEFATAGAKLVSLQAHVSDRRIVAAGEPADVVGINCPLGWPDDFVDFVNELRRGSVAQRADKPPDWRAISPTARRIDS